MGKIGVAKRPGLWLLLSQTQKKEKEKKNQIPGLHGQPSIKTLLQRNSLYLVKEGLLPKAPRPLI